MELALLEKELSYVVLSNDLKPGDPSIPLYNHAYLFWRDFWNDIFRSVGSKDRVTSDQFLRHDAISMLMRRDEIVGMHCYTYFDLDVQADREHPYFANSCSPRAMKILDDMKIKTIMTLEYFAVAKEWQKKSREIAMGVVVISLSQKLFLEMGMDMWMGVPRADIGVAKLCYAMGGIPLEQGILVHGVLSDVTGVTPERATFVGTDRDKQLVNTLWNKRDIRFSLPSERSVKKAA